MVLSRRIKPFIFIDFDGTITEKDTIIAIMGEFASNEWKKFKDQIFSREISVREGVGKLFNLVSSAKKNEIVTFVKEKARIRKGFREFIQFCEENEINYLVLSGGLDFYIYPLINEIISTEKILCNFGEFSNANIQITWKYPCDSYCHLDCGICKVSLIRTYDPSFFCRILIGDSVTDFGAAAISDRVIARDSLLGECQDQGIRAAPFSQFFDVMKLIRNDESLF